MANYTGMTSSATPQLTLLGRGYQHRTGNTSAFGPDQQASLVSKMFKARAGRTAQRLGPNVVVNRVFDSVAGKTVQWESALPDTLGAYYPGPGSFGVTTSGYTVVDIVAR